jgi:hypothetical protein
LEINEINKYLIIIRISIHFLFLYLVLD